MKKVHSVKTIGYFISTLVPTESEMSSSSDLRPELIVVPAEHWAII